MLKLKLEELAVESFDTAPALAERGTVRGYETAQCYTVYGPEATCGNIASCDVATCGLDCTRDWNCQMRGMTDCGAWGSGCMNSLSDCYCNGAKGCETIAARTSCVDEQ